MEDIDTTKALETWWCDQVKRARDDERAAVVAWLRDEVDAAMKMRFPVRAAQFFECAEAIERGEHRREEER